MSEIDIKEVLTKISNQVDPIIERLLKNNIEGSSVEMALYQCGVGGKRIRPALLILTGQAFGAKIKDLLYPSASIEILHNLTLIIDDIIDHSEFRRDKPTVWKKYGKSIAMCDSLFYGAAVFEGLEKYPSLLPVYSRALKVITDGEIKDILFERNGRTDEPFVVDNRYKKITKQDYFEMINQKTAVLLEASCQAGAIIGGASEEMAMWAGCFGFNLGMAFQIKDDILDIFGDEKEFGKKIGKDIIEKKLGNFVILTALDNLTPNRRKLISTVLEGDNPVFDEDLEKVRLVIEESGAKAASEKVAESYINQAYDALEKLPKSEFRDMLRYVADYVVNRNK